MDCSFDREFVKGELPRHPHHRGLTRTIHRAFISFSSFAISSELLLDVLLEDPDTAAAPVPAPAATAPPVPLLPPIPDVAVAGFIGDLYCVTG